MRVCVCSTDKCIHITIYVLAHVHINEPILIYYLYYTILDTYIQYYIPLNMYTVKYEYSIAPIACA